MIFRSLKITLFQSISLMMVLALASVAVVFLSFWYTDILHSHLQSNRFLLHGWKRQLETHPEDRGKEDTLRKICHDAGKQCENAFIFSRQFEQTLYETKLVSHQTILAGLNSRQEFVTLLGDQSFLGMLHRRQAVLAVPVDFDEKGYLGIIYTIPPIFESIQPGIRFIAALLGVNALIFSALIFFRLVQRLLKPLERLVSLSQKYSRTNNLMVHVEDDGNELQQLSRSLHTIFAQIEADKEQLRTSCASLQVAQQQLIATQKEMIQAEKMASIGRLSAGLAHEIGNPIGIVQGYVELLAQNDLMADDRLEFARRAEKELLRVAGLIRNLLDYSGPAVHSSQNDTSVVGVIDNAIEVMKTQKEVKNTTILLENSSNHDRVNIASEALYQVLLNCLLNAADAIADSENIENGLIIIRCEEKPHFPDWLVVSITDNGSGIATEHLDCLFEPFFSTKGPGRGTGLGLSVSQSLVQAAGGIMVISNSETAGAIVRIELPLLPENFIH